MLNQVVVIRDHMAGVFVGTLTTLDLAAKTWTLRNARKVHTWEGSFAVEGLATYGPGEGSLITATVDEIAGCSLVQVVATTPAAAESLMDAPEHRP